MDYTPHAGERSPQGIPFSGPPPGRTPEGEWCAIQNEDPAGVFGGRWHYFSSTSLALTEIQVRLEVRDVSNSALHATLRDDNTGARIDGRLRQYSTVSSMGFIWARSPATTKMSLEEYLKQFRQLSARPLGLDNAAPVPPLSEVSGGRFSATPDSFTTSDLNSRGTPATTGTPPTYNALATGARPYSYPVSSHLSSRQLLVHCIH